MKRIRLILAEVACACLLVFLAVTGAKADDCDTGCYNTHGCGQMYQDANTFANVGLCDIAFGLWWNGESCSADCGCHGMSSGISCAQ